MTRIDKFWMGPNQQWLVIWSMTYNQWWAQLTKKLASITANPLTEKTEQEQVRSEDYARQIYI